MELMAYNGQGNNHYGWPGNYMLRLHEKVHGSVTRTEMAREIGEFMWPSRNTGGGYPILPEQCYAAGACYQTTVDNVGDSWWANYAYWKWRDTATNTVQSSGRGSSASSEFCICAAGMQPETTGSGDNIKTICKGCEVRRHEECNDNSLLSTCTWFCSPIPSNSLIIQQRQNYSHTLYVCRSLAKGQGEKRKRLPKQSLAPPP